MGSTRIFTGFFRLNKPLEDELFVYLNKFAETRRMKRDPKILEQMGQGTAESFGIDGEFFVGGLGDFGQDEDESIIDYNEPPKTQPGLWCKWTPTKDKTCIEWNGHEKFYDATEWISYIIKNFLEPNGYVLNGVINAKRPDGGDKHHIRVSNNAVSTGRGHK